MRRGDLSSVVPVDLEKAGAYPDGLGLMEIKPPHLHGSVQGAHGRT